MKKLLLMFRKVADITWARWLSGTMSFGVLLFSVWLFDQCFDIPQAPEFILLSVFLFICVFEV